MEDIIILVLGGLLIFAALVFVFIIPIVIARWIFRINEQIELMSQIRDELKKLNQGDNEQIELMSQIRDELKKLNLKG